MFDGLQSTILRIRPTESLVASQIGKQFAGKTPEVCGIRVPARPGRVYNAWQIAGRNKILRT